MAAQPGQGATDDANLAWIHGFRDRLEGRDRPASGKQKQLGWDAADRLAPATAYGGGYGQPTEGAGG